MRKYVPNILSLFRILLVPAFMVSFFLENDYNYYIALTFFVISGLSDVFDGLIARKYNCVSSLGKLLDPVADKLIQFGVIAALVMKKLVPIFVPVVFAVKELITVIGAAFVYKKHAVIAVSDIFGKISTVLFYITMGFIILLSALTDNGIIVMSEPIRFFIITALGLVSSVAALFAIINYIFIYKKYVTKNRTEKAD